MTATDDGDRPGARVKVCGLTREADVRAVVDSGADAVGVITDVPVETPREVDPERAAALVARVPPLVTSVLVTMPESVEAAVSLVDRVEPDALQVHGTLSPAAVGALRSRVSVPVIPVVDADAPEELAAYADAGDAVLVDSVSEDGGGGTGRTHDWERTALATSNLDRVILAGGLTPENVAEAVETVDPFAVDVASGVEREGGVKDHDAVRRFVARARGSGGGDAATDGGVSDPEVAR